MIILANLSARWCIFRILLPARVQRSCTFVSQEMQINLTYDQWTLKLLRRVLSAQGPTLPMLFKVARQISRTVHGIKEAKTMIKSFFFISLAVILWLQLGFGLITTLAIVLGIYLSTGGWNFATVVVKTLPRDGRYVINKTNVKKLNVVIKLSSTCQLSWMGLYIAVVKTKSYLVLDTWLRLLISETAVIAGNCTCNE